MVNAKAVVTLTDGAKKTYSTKSSDILTDAGNFKIGDSVTVYPNTEIQFMNKETNTGLALKNVQDIPEDYKITDKDEGPYNQIRIRGLNLLTADSPIINSPKPFTEKSESDEPVQPEAEVPDEDIPKESVVEEIPLSQEGELEQEVKEELIFGLAQDTFFIVMTLVILLSVGYYHISYYTKGKKMTKYGF